MSDLNEQERDLLDGGFAKVDRERIIEEETREVTPWYKQFINVFIAPSKMIHENFGQEPVKNMSVQVVGAILFMVLTMIVSFINPEFKTQILDTYRQLGMEESAIEQVYATAQISGTIGAVLGVFLSALIMALCLMVIKAICKDAGKFSSLYKLALLVIMITGGVSFIGALLGLILKVTPITFSIQMLLGENLLKTNAFLVALSSMISLTNVWSAIIMGIGYKTITGTSTKKACGVIVTYQLIYFIYIWISTTIGFAAAANLPM